MTSTYQVGAIPFQLLTPGRRKDSLICNISAATVWLSDSSSVSEGYGFPLNKGYAIQWDCDLNLWVVSPGGSTIVIQDMRGQYFDIGSES